MLLIPFIGKNKHISGIFLTMKGDIIFDVKLNEHNLHAHFAEYSSTINFKNIDQRRYRSCGYKRENRWRQQQTRKHQLKEIYYTAEKKYISEIGEPCNHKVHFEFRALCWTEKYSKRCNDKAGKTLVAVKQSNSPI